MGIGGVPFNTTRGLQEDWRWAWRSLALAVLANEDQPRLGAVCLARKSQGGVGEGMRWLSWLGVQVVEICLLVVVFF